MDVCGSKKLVVCGQTSDRTLLFLFVSGKVYYRTVRTTC